MIFYMAEVMADELQTEPRKLYEPISHFIYAMFAIAYGRILAS